MVVIFNGFLQVGTMIMVSNGDDDDGGGGSSELDFWNLRFLINYRVNYICGPDYFN